MPVWIIALFLFSAASTAFGFSIENVHANMNRLNFTKGDRFAVQFNLSGSAHVVLRIYDGREWLIKEISTKQLFASGENKIEWDGRDQSNNIVPDEAYTYTLEARDERDQVITYDPADQTGGGDLIAKNVRWDAANKRIRYFINQSGRVSVRVGLKNNGPLLKTVVDWVPRSAGEHEEAWDGKDESGVLDLSNHADLMVGVLAYSLPENTLIVGEPHPTVQLVTNVNWSHPVRPVSKEVKKRMFLHSQQPLESRGDYAVRIELPENVPRSAAGIPVLTEVTAFRLVIDEKDLERVLSRRFEPVFFVDGQYVFENEVGFVPMTWNWDPKAVNEGEHFITVNVRGYEGNFGMATVKVLVEHSTKPSENKNETQ